MGWYGAGMGLVWVAWGYNNGVKWYQTSPLYSVVDETDDGEDGKDSKDNTSAPEVFVKVINSSTSSKGHVQYASEPNKLLYKGISTKEVPPGEDQGLSYWC
jgi:hypothetical protein